MYWITAFGNVTLPVLRSREFAGTGTASNFTLLPLAGGGVYDSLGEDRAYTQGVQIEVEGSIVLEEQGTAAFEAQERSLRGLVGQYDVLWREWDNSGLLEWCWARCVSVGQARTSRNQVHLSIPIVFQMESAAWYGETDTDILDTDPLGDLALLCAENEEVYPVVYALVNNGRMPQRDVTFKVTAKGAAVTAVTISNSVSGHTLAWAGSLAAGTTLVIDCGRQSIQNDGADCYAELTVPTDKDEWMIMEPGVNPISINITETGTESTIEIYFFDSHA
jgi:hypothetical protein